MEADVVIALPSVVVAAGDVEGAPVVRTGDVTSVTPGGEFEGTTGDTPTLVVVADGPGSWGPDWDGPAEQAQKRLGAKANADAKRFEGRFTSLL